MYMEIIKKIHALKQHGISLDIPNISLTNARFLRDLIHIQQTQNMLEIGTANWFSAINFALELKKTWGKLTTIEFSPLSREAALTNFKDFEVEDIIDSRLGNALDILPTLQEIYDFVFIDGMKKRTKDFLELTYPKVKDGWIIIIDDVIKFREKMTWLYEYLEEKNISYNILPIDTDDGIIMIIK